MGAGSALGAVGPYKLGEILGDGSMGAVYRSQHPRTSDPVAVKVPHEEMRDAHWRGYFQRELRCVRAVHHPNSVSLIDSGFDDELGLPYGVFSLHEGQTLRETVINRPMIPSRAVDLMIMLLDALDECDRSGVVHRDVKPSNVMLVEDKAIIVNLREPPVYVDEYPMLIDFGLARTKFDQEAEEASVGTPIYMAPEQARGEDLTSKVDVFAAALVMLELLVGTPYTWKTEEMDAIDVIKTRSYRPFDLEPFAKHAPPELLAIMSDALIFDPVRRATAAEFRAALKTHRGDR